MENKVREVMIMLGKELLDRAYNGEERKSIVESEQLFNMYNNIFDKAFENGRAAMPPRMLLSELGRKDLIDLIEMFAIWMVNTEKAVERRKRNINDNVSDMLDELVDESERRYGAYDNIEVAFLNTKKLVDKRRGN